MKIRNACTLFAMASALSLVPLVVADDRAPVPVPAAAAIPLEGVNWIFADTPGRSGVLAEGGHVMMIYLDAADKQLRGTGPCNSFTSSYDFGHEDLKFTSIVATLLSCEQFDAKEKQFINALQSARAYRIRGMKLELLDGDNKLVASFEAQALDPGPGAPVDSAPAEHSGN